MRGYGSDEEKAKTKSKRMRGSINDSFPEMQNAVAKPKPVDKPSLSAAMPSPPFHTGKVRSKPRRRRRFSNA